jgi:serine/threonine-protein kinase PknG
VRYYDLVSRADPSYTSAAFGLARCLEQKGDRDGAVAAYGRVPATSNRYAAAQIAVARALLSDGASAPELAQASEAIERLDGVVEGLELQQVSADLLCRAAELIEVGAVQPEEGGIRILGASLLPSPLRLAAERALRTCARYATGRNEKVRFIDEANRARPLTLF